MREAGMSTQVTIDLPDEIYRRAEQLAGLTQRNVSDVLADTLELSLPTWNEPSEPLRPVTELPDEEVLALTELQMERAQDERFSLLLDKQQAGELSEAERPELLALLQLYQEGLLLKAQALQEAVRRGLREPLEW
jgi:hypothetical protein